MTTTTESLAVLQRMVDGYVPAIGVALDALTDENTPQPARQVLCGVLNYVLDLLDIFPDHYQGLGVADDAILLRLAARRAVAAGATQAALATLAAEAAEVDAVLGDLAAPLDRYVEKLVEREVRGRTVAQILGDKAVASAFVADVQRQIKAHKPSHIDASLPADYHVGELRRMIKHAMKKEGLLGA